MYFEQHQIFNKPLSQWRPKKIPLFYGIVRNSQIMMMEKVLNMCKMNSQWPFLCYSMNFLLHILEWAQSIVSILFRVRISKCFQRRSKIEGSNNWTVQIWKLSLYPIHAHDWCNESKNSFENVYAYKLYLRIPIVSNVKNISRTISMFRFSARWFVHSAEYISCEFNSPSANMQQV